MTDIVKRLRRRYFSPVAVFRNPDGPEAADEIERLRATLRRALHLHDIEQAERPTPNIPAWVEGARALLEDKP